MREQIRQVLSSQRQPTITVLSSLLAVQDSLHYIPDEAIRETATFSGSTINEVWSVASFYTNFRFTPPGEKTLDVCWGPSCHLLGAQEVLNAVHLALEIEEEKRAVAEYGSPSSGASLGEILGAAISEKEEAAQKSDVDDDSEDGLADGSGDGGSDTDQE